jgi:hypothetical protein
MQRANFNGTIIKKQLKTEYYEIKLGY